MNKLYGMPILIGFIISYIYPDYAFEYGSYAIYLLFTLSALTSTKYKWAPLKKIKFYSFSLSFCFVFSYLFILPLINLVCNIFSLNHSYRVSLLLVASAPFALIAPLFTRKFLGDTSLSQIMVFASSVLTPVVVYLMLKIFDNQGLSAYSIEPVGRILGIISLIMLLSITISHFFSFFSGPLWFKIQGYGSSAIIASLVYIFWGQTWPLLSNRSTDHFNIIFTICILLFFDFGIFFLLKILYKINDTEQTKALRTTLSMKNMAVPATLIATYSPNMLFIPAIGFACHILFFNYLALTKNI